ncbi:MAG: ATP-binding protein [Pseudomonadota bacterium]
MRMHEIPHPAGFQPALAAADPLAAHWLAQATLRLRREICWLWRERGLLAGADPVTQTALLPPLADPLQSALDLTRWGAEKAEFLARDETAAWLGEHLRRPEPGGPGEPVPRRGGFAWVARELELAGVERFVLALALLAAADSAAGSVFAACLNDAGRTRPSLALAQRLWERPEDVIALADPGHRLFRFGLLSGGADWDTPLAVAPAVAACLLDPPRPPATREEGPAPAAHLALAAARLQAAPRDRLHLQPLLGGPDAPLAETAAALAARLGSRVGLLPPGLGPEHLSARFTLAWLQGLMPCLDFALLERDAHQDGPVAIPLPGLPLTVFVFVEDRTQARRLPAAHTLSLLTPPALDYAGRLAHWRTGLADHLGQPGLDGALAEAARRFHFPPAGIERVCATLRCLGRPPQAQDVLAACRGDVHLGELAQPVDPRFTLDDLLLPPRQAGQIRELVRAAAQVTRVHHEWGTARAWNEGGLSALFAGPPGTGKTMAAEVIARAVGMPMYRIDLSQVVNKYVGETEKNLRRLFDAADAADVILFFDEADALFGKRTEVKDAHDRYANQEVGYLLERMERFRGLAILATNRKKDLDEAFLRRLRFLVDFPLPGPEERQAIWRRAMPPAVDVSALDFPFLARQFALAGGHIRSVVFQACLQGAAREAGRRLDMPVVLGAVRRELDKLGRPVSPDLFGPWAPQLED